MIFLQNVVWFLVLIGIMILIHELGHFWAARFFDVRVEAFSFGFGPRLFGFRRGETDYRVSAIPFGGYVKMTGEQPGDENSADPRGFLSHPRWQRLIIAFAGPLMNIILAVALLTGLYMVKYERVAEPAGGSVIGYVTPNSPAAKAGIQNGDKIVRLDGKDNPNWEDIKLKEFSNAYHALDVTIDRQGRRFQTTVTPVLDDQEGAGSAGWALLTEVQVHDVSPGMPAEKAGLRRGDLLLSANGVAVSSPQTLTDVVRGSNGRPVTLEFMRNGQRQSVTVQPVSTMVEGKSHWMVGIAPARKVKVITTQLSFTHALTESVHDNLRSATLILQFLRGLLERRMSPKQLSGPIDIGRMSGEAAREGPTAYIGLMAMVSLNLAIFNLLPIPILDGGIILLLLIESLMGRDLSLSVKETALKLGFVFLMMVVAFVLYNDISKYLPQG